MRCDAAANRSRAPAFLRASPWRASYSLSCLSGCAQWGRGPLCGVRDAPPPRSWDAHAPAD
eukprot:5639645-Prymnesium_polylepis.1